ncbi:hypothetical protein Back11_18370 [Paenibacillus baekrokdamisoli]|uniref:DUF6199 domain-containing protein n=1 Tax=Paenibacillus baekrokdamisoli TaxID=1712516 RepID=A0A3G9IQD8_9BACL|nr:DUF6199 family natural product biosynthesis protein [Paenibacillus baekrokdamisoli]MBB3072433.1 hypothetical protein [Paenibacillus baekrokdamisoli]BBH20492.1 hypothetical protein Back11_18370 [Paenibacillus baekrokdamisoli]
MFILFVILALIGLLMFTKPAFIWMISESWKSNDATEPSDLYNWSTRFGGIICMIVGIAGFIVLLI